MSLTDYKRAIYRRYNHAPHLEALDTALMQLTRFVETGGAEGVGRLIVEMPPRHGKTLSVSRLYPTWHLGRNPDHRVILVSYGADLAEKSGRAARNIVASKAYGEVFPAVSLARDSKSISAWDIEGRDGGMDVLGIGAGATGKGAHLLVIDDPIKNREQAESELWRDKVWESYTDDLYTRLEPGGAIIVMMTRWHEDDLIGRLLTREVGKWARLRLPALAEPDDPLGRSEGAALWPERYPANVLNDIGLTLGTYGWNALYQQAPRPREGAMFKRHWFPIVDAAAKTVRQCRYWDKAATEGGTGAASAGVLLAIGDDGLIYIEDAISEHLSAGARETLIKQVAQLDSQRHGGKSAVRIVTEQEPGSGGKESADSTIRNLMGYNVHADRPTGDKNTRLEPFAAQAEAGNVRLVRGDWNHAYIEEMISIPFGVRRDMGDATSGAFNQLASAGELTMTSEAPKGLADFFNGAL